MSRQSRQQQPIHAGATRRAETKSRETPTAPPVAWQWGSSLWNTRKNPINSSTPRVNDNFANPTNEVTLTIGKWAEFIGTHINRRLFPDWLRHCRRALARWQWPIRFAHLDVTGVMGPVRKRGLTLRWAVMWPPAYYTLHSLSLISDHRREKNVLWDLSSLFVFWGPNSLNFFSVLAKYLKPSDFPKTSVAIQTNQEGSAKEDETPQGPMEDWGSFLWPKEKEKEQKKSFHRKTRRSEPYVGPFSPSLYFHTGLQDQIGDKNVYSCHSCAYKF